MTDAVPPSTALVFDQSDKHNSTSPSAIQLKNGYETISTTDRRNKPTWKRWMNWHLW